MVDELINLRVSTHSGDVDDITVTTYNADTIAEQINNMDIHAIALGDNVYSRVDIKNIKKISV